MAEKLQRELNNRHIQLIAIGGATGIGLFLGAGQTTALTGPSILLTYIIIGFMLLMFTRGLGETIIQNTGFKSFADITNTYIGPLAGSATGWTYQFCWIITGMAEVIAVAKHVSFWFPEIPNWISAFLCVLLSMSFNLLSARLFGELEFWFSIVEIATIIGLIVVGFIMILFVYKTQFGHASFTNLYEHGVFPKGTSGSFMSSQMALSPFIGIGMIDVTVGETKDPVRTIPKTINGVPIRILIFYAGALAVIMSIIPWQRVDPDNSLFVKLFALTGIPFVTGLINSVVLTTAASSYDSDIFSDSRMLFGLSSQQQAPPNFSKTNKYGASHVAIFASSALSLVAVLLDYIFPDATKVFTCVTITSTILFLAVWGLIIIAYISYSRKNPDLHKKVTYKLFGGKYTGYLIFVFLISVLGLLFINVETRRTICSIPIWFILLGFMYLRYKHIAAKSSS